MVFTVLVYLLSWWPALLPAGGLLPHEPAVAAVIVIGLTRGPAGLRAWTASLVPVGRRARAGMSGRCSFRAGWLSP